MPSELQTESRSGSTLKAICSLRQNVVTICSRQTFKGTMSVHLKLNSFHKALIKYVHVYDH